MARMVVDLLNNNKSWKGKYFKVYIKDHFPFEQEWPSQMPKCKQPLETPRLREVFHQIGLEVYD